MRTSLVLAAVLVAAPLAGCATGKSEVPDCVKRYVPADTCSCDATGLGTATVVHGANKTLAGATKGAVTGMGQGASTALACPQTVVYTPFALVGGAFTGFVDGIGHVPAEQSCHYGFPQSLGYAWWRDYRVGTQNAQVPEHRFRAADGSDGQWNGGSFWPGGPKN